MILFLETFFLSPKIPLAVGSQAWTMSKNSWNCDYLIIICPKIYTVYNVQCAPLSKSFGGATQHSVTNIRIFEYIQIFSATNIRLYHIRIEISYSSHYVLVFHILLPPPNLSFCRIRPDRVADGQTLHWRFT